MPWFQDWNWSNIIYSKYQKTSVIFCRFHQLLLFENLFRTHFDRRNEMFDHIFPEFLDNDHFPFYFEEVLQIVNEIVHLDICQRSSLLLGCCKTYSIWTIEQFYFSKIVSLWKRHNCPVVFVNIVHLAIQHNIQFFWWVIFSVQYFSLLQLQIMQPMDHAMSEIEVQLKQQRVFYQLLITT